jgi:preprotein translocase subunit SecG
MIAVLLVVHIFIALALVGVILIQKSEGGALGIGGGGMSGFMTGRSTANLLTRTTAGLAVAFFVTSIALAIFSGHGRATHSLVDEGPLPVVPALPLPASSAPGPAPAPGTATPAPAPGTAAPAPAPVAPATPSAPLAK